MISIVIALFSITSAQAFTLGSGIPNDTKGWPGEKLTFTVNLASCAGLSRATVEGAIKDGMAIWNEVTDSRLKIEMGGDSTTTGAQALAGTASDTAVIVCDSSFNTTTSQAGDNGVLGVGAAAFPAGSKEFTKGFIVLNADTGASPSNNISTISTTKLSIIIAHELGHALGFGHSGDSKALMYFNVSAKLHLALSQDDMDAMAYLYGRSEPSGGIFGCGTLDAGSGAGPGPWNGMVLYLFWFFLIPALAVQWQKMQSRARSLA